MKQVIFAVLFASVCCLVIPIYGQTASKNPRTDKAGDSQSLKVDAVNVDTGNVMKLNIPQQAEADRKPEDNKKESKAYFSRLIAPENLPNLILGAVGIAGVFVALRTLKAIRRQGDWMERQTGILVEYNKATRDSADATAKSAAATERTVGLLEKQVKVQQMTMSQWVTFQGWKHKVRKNTEGDWLLEFNFDIVNPTNWPINLVSTILRIRGRESMTNHFVPLLPKEPYTVGMSQIVMGQGGGYFEGGMTGFVLFGAIVYVDCFGDPQNQIFSGYLSCIEGGQTNFRMEYFPENPYMKHQEKPKEAEQHPSIPPN